MCSQSQAKTGLMGGKQLGFSDYELNTAKKQTKREKLLSEMEVVVPWQTLIDLIEPYYPKTSKKDGRPPYPLATMLRGPAKNRCKINVMAALTNLHLARGHLLATA
jgi:hypothetical protein